MDATEIVALERQREREYLALAAHVKAALSTPDGKVLREWLYTNCFMDTPLDSGQFGNVAWLQRICGRRDLFIAIQQMEKDGAHVTGTN